MREKSMNIGKITVSQLIVKVNVSFEKILDINIVQKENEQGMRQHYRIQQLQCFYQITEYFIVVTVKT